MNKINITKISPETPVLASYIRRMSSWGENGAFCSEVVAEKKENSNFYGIFYGVSEHCMGCYLDNAFIFRSPLK